ncbi:MAG: hypothetical protein EHM70_06890 [Chloroflexota bacterium]|nr:MAG: hypothetical protein EHM70_06890 [Chloroflexota bacterium]
MKEPSVLDYVKAKLTPWRGPAPCIPPLEPDGQPIRKPDMDLAIGYGGQTAGIPVVIAGAAPARQAIPLKIAWPWVSFSAFFVALAAQLSLEPRINRDWKLGAVLYAVALVLAGYANLRGEWHLPPFRPALKQRDPLSVNLGLLTAGLVVTLLAFWLFQGNRFTKLNLFFWIVAIVFVALAFWLKEPRRKNWYERLAGWARRPQWGMVISRWTLLVLAAAGLVIFFRVYRIADTPPQMNSDHAEKLLDVMDVLNGQTSVFFPRNTGREAMQMYLTAAVARIFNTGISFLSLKIGTVLAGLLTLPFIYLLGKETGNRSVGLMAMVFAGIAYWPNVISRVGLRFPLYPLFVAPTLYFLLRGLRTSNRNNFIWAGLALGIGLHGYTPIRILPFVVLAAVGLYLIHSQSREVRQQTLAGLVVIAMVALVVFIPLLAYASQNPDMFGYRAFSRLGTVERPLPGPVYEVFLKNVWNAVTMFAWDDGFIWPVSVTNRPALDVVSGALFYTGTALLLVRYIRRRHWLDLFLLLAVPLLMLPSILSLAFPDENPALNRASGAIVPVFVIIGLALDGLAGALKNRLPHPAGAWAAGALVASLLLISSAQNYDLVFRQYQQSYDAASWNHDEIGAVIRSFYESVGSPDSAWVVAVPHWADTRLVGMTAGQPAKNYAIDPNGLADSLAAPGPKLFLVNPNDTASLQTLKVLYPEGWTRLYDSKYENKDFYLFFVPTH